jgi:hypothetical protein
MDLMLLGFRKEKIVHCIRLRWLILFFLQAGMLINLIGPNKLWWFINDHRIRAQFNIVAFGFQIRFLFLIILNLRVQRSINCWGLGLIYWLMKKSELLNCDFLLCGISKVFPLLICLDISWHKNIDIIIIAGKERKCIFILPVYLMMLIIFHVHRFQWRFAENIS